MANEQNLRPCEYKLSQEEAKKGGIKSGETRRKKKDTAQLINMMLTSKLDDKSKAKVKQLAENLDDDDLDVNALMTAGMVKSAINGNVKAYECLQNYNSKAEKQNDSYNNYTIPIIDITTDFVERIS